MKPRRTHDSTNVLGLPGANEDADLWVQVAQDESGQNLISSVWVPTPHERQQIADGGNVELIVWGTAQPPVAMIVTHVGIGRPPPSS